MKFVPKVPINNIQALVHIMAWRRLGDKPLSEPMMVSFPTHICVTRSQWVNFNAKLAGFCIIIPHWSDCEVFECSVMYFNNFILRGDQWHQLTGYKIGWVFDNWFDIKEAVCSCHVQGIISILLFTIRYRWRYPMLSHLQTRTDSCCRVGEDEIINI